MLLSELVALPPPVPRACLFLARWKRSAASSPCPLSLRSSTGRPDCSIIPVHVWTERVETTPHRRGQPQELHREDFSQGLILQDLRFTRTRATARGRTDAKLQCPGARQPCWRVGGKSPTKPSSLGSRAQTLPLLVVQNERPGDTQLAHHLPCQQDPGQRGQAAQSQHLDRAAPRSVDTRPQPVPTGLIPPISVELTPRDCQPRCASLRA